MANDNAPPDASAPIPFTVWETSGLTEHMGGPAATRLLLALCGAKSAQTVLDLGCGTGYTASLLAREHGMRVLAVDLGAVTIAATQARAHRSGFRNTITPLRADGQALPLADASVDLVLTESVSVFCDLERLTTEVWRVLRPSGVFGDNELTLRGPAPAELHGLLSDLLGIPGRQEAEWRAAWERAGFTGLASVVRPISLREQFMAHLAVDGWRGYLGGMRRGLADRALARTFFNRRTLRAARQFLPLVGYGLYAGRKPRRS